MNLCIVMEVIQKKPPATSCRNESQSVIFSIWKLTGTMNVSYETHDCGILNC